MIVWVASWVALAFSVESRREESLALLEAIKTLVSISTELAIANAGASMVDVSLPVFLEV